MEAVKVAVANDHAGYHLKLLVVAHMRELGHEVSDLGSHSTEPVDYPPYCAACAREVVGGKADFGVVIGGSGQGEQMAANKVHGARAALCHDEYTARFARMHNDANVLALGARILAPELAFDIVDVFLATAFQGGRHQVRVNELAEIEAEESRAWLAAHASGQKPGQEARAP
jgi:ribose 5-phosphate isomerase B